MEEVALLSSHMNSGFEEFPESWRTTARGIFPSSLPWQALSPSKMNLSLTFYARWDLSSILTGLLEPNQALLQPKAEGQKGALAREGLKIGR
jgi:hypothetical protein